MSRVHANCPSCGGPVKFRVGTSLVAVCEFCRTVVGRGDRKVEDFGKVAEIVETASPLQLGLRGKHDGKGFEIVGRCQFAHEAGGVWDEWYCAFGSKRWGWLAEAQGRFYLTFEQDIPEGVKLPGHDKLAVGRQVNMPEVGLLTVAEVGTAKAAGAAGELPFELHPGTEHPFADLYGANGEFATFSYGDDPARAYVGHEVTLDDLGIDARAKSPEKEARHVAAVGVACPQCGGALELKAPDQTQRVVCPYCRSMLDATQGALTYLSTLEIPERSPLIPLGTKGTLQGTEYTVIGYMTRAVTYLGVDYFWDEYLLYNPRVGFRWLVNGDDHWSFVRPISPGEIHEAGHHLTWQGKTFKLFQRGVAEVRYVVGEFYWKVTLGEQVQATDYICPPEMVSIEDSVRFFENVGSTSAERNVSLGTYTPHAEIEQAFSVQDLPRGSKVFPNQPFHNKTIYRDAAMFAAILFVLGMWFVATSRSNEVYRKTLTVTSAGIVNPQTPQGMLPRQPVPMPGQILPGQPLLPAAATAQPAAAANPPGTSPPAAAAPADPKVYFSEQPLELHSRQPVTISVQTSVQNSWVYVEGDLFNEETGLVQSFDVPVEYYTGVEGGESWSEGSRANSTVVSALPGGKYSLRLEVQTGSTMAEPVIVTVSEGGFRLPNFLLALAAVAVIPAIVGIRHHLFDRARWAESDYSPYAGLSSGGDDDDE